MDQQKNNKISGMVVVIAILFFFFFGRFLEFIIPILLGFIPIIVIGIIIYKENKKKKNNKQEFDVNKSYYRRKDVDEGLLDSKGLEEMYLKERNYNVADEKHLFYQKKITEFDKSHRHENMYPDEQKKKIVKLVKKELPSNEEQLKSLNQELRQLKKDYTDYKIGIIEFNENKLVLKELIKDLNKKIADEKKMKAS